jgi:hypothetical protein
MVISCRRSALRSVNRPTREEQLALEMFLHPTSLRFEAVHAGHHVAVDLLESARHRVHGRLLAVSGSDPGRMRAGSFDFADAFRAEHSDVLDMAPSPSVGETRRDFSVFSAASLR